MRLVGDATRGRMSFGQRRLLKSCTGSPTLIRLGRVLPPRLLSRTDRGQGSFLRARSSLPFLNHVAVPDNGGYFVLGTS